jgi:hypothetical protein
MWKIVTQEQIGALAKERAVVSILLARSMNAEFLSWLYGSWDEINDLAGRRWHIVIPSRSSDWLWNTGRASPRDFNTQLSLEMANSYGISMDELPCLVMEDFCEDATPIRISIPSEERERAKFVDEFSRLAKSLGDEDLEPRWTSRRDINAMIAYRIQAGTLKSIALRALPRAAGSLARFSLSKW